MGGRIRLACGGICGLNIRGPKRGICCALGAEGVCGAGRTCLPLLPGETRRPCARGMRCHSLRVLRLLGGSVSGQDDMAKNYIGRLRSIRKRECEKQKEKRVASGIRTATR